MDKKEIQRKYYNPIDSYDLEGDLFEIAEKIRTLPDTMRKNNLQDNFDLYHRYRIEVSSESGYYDSSSVEISVIAYRWETDEELNERIANNRITKIAAEKKAQQDKIIQEKRERSLFETLKQKFADRS